MASKLRTSRADGTRVKRLALYGTICALGLAGFSGCANGEPPAQQPPTTQPAEQTPGTTPTASAAAPVPAGTAPASASIVGAIDTAGLNPVAIELAKKATPELLAAMSPEDRVNTLTITPEMYSGDTEKLADLQLVQFGAMVGLASDEGFADDLPGLHEEWIAFGNTFMDSVYGGPVSASSETAASQFPFVVMRTTAIIDGRKIAASSAGQGVPGFKIVFRKIPGTTETVGGDTVMNSADISLKVAIEAPVDYSALPNDPYIADPNSPGMGDGLPSAETARLLFSDVKERNGTVAPTAIVLSQ